mmetsp:Transcript_82881/g.168938  ORF Transcript_82881/g.168938 Transcript_82881/m.168938 type:complete len:536 (-) Transcript_82881:175-1782(-)
MGAEEVARQHRHEVRAVLLAVPLRQRRQRALGEAVALRRRVQLAAERLLRTHRVGGVAREHDCGQHGHDLDGAGPRLELASGPQDVVVHRHVVQPEVHRLGRHLVHGRQASGEVQHMRRLVALEQVLHGVQVTQVAVLAAHEHPVGAGRGVVVTRRASHHNVGRQLRGAASTCARPGAGASASAGLKEREVLRAGGLGQLGDLLLHEAAEHAVGAGDQHHAARDKLEGQHDVHQLGDTVVLDAHLVHADEEAAGVDHLRAREVVRLRVGAVHAHERLAHHVAGDDGAVLHAASLHVLQVLTQLVRVRTVQHSADAEPGRVGALGRLHEGHVLAVAGVGGQGGLDAAQVVAAALVERLELAQLHLQHGALHLQGPEVVAHVHEQEARVELRVGCLHLEPVGEVARPTVGAQAAHKVVVLQRVAHHHAALAAGDVVGEVERVRAEVAEGAQHLARHGTILSLRVRPRTQRLARVLQQNEVVLLAERHQLAHVAGVAQHVHRHHGLHAGGHAALQLRDVAVERLRVNVHEARHQPTLQ